MPRYFEIEEKSFSGVAIREVWIEGSRDKTLFNCFTDEALELAVEVLENKGFINVTDKSSKGRKGDGNNVKYKIKVKNKENKRKIR